MVMHLGISSYTYPWSIGVPGSLPEQPLTALGLLSQAVQLGVKVAQIADNLPLDRLTPLEIEAVKTESDRQGIQIEVGTRGIAPDHLRRYLEIARFFHSPLLRVVVDTVEHHPSPEQVVTILKPFRAEFESSNVRLALENHDRFSCQTWIEIVRKLSEDWVGICLDTVNSLGALEGPEIVVERLGPWTINLHLKDFTIFRASHQMGFLVEGRPAGQGKLDIPWLLEKFADNSRTPNAILELWTPPETKITATISKEESWAEESIAYLRKLISD